MCLPQAHYTALFQSCTTAHAKPTALQFIMLSRVQWWREGLQRPVLYVKMLARIQSIYV